MTQLPGHEQTTMGKWLFMCGAAIVALAFLLISSVFGAIAVPNHTELERSLTPSPPPPTPIPTPIPTRIPQPVPLSSQGNSSDTDVMLLAALMVVLAMIGTALIAMLMTRLHGRVVASAPPLPPPSLPPSLPSSNAGISQPDMAQQLEVFSYTIHNRAFIAGKQATREAFWRNEAARTANEHAKRKAAQATDVQPDKTREPAVLRNSRRLHTKPAPDADASHAGRRNGKVPHKDTGRRL